MSVRPRLRTVGRGRITVSEGGRVGRGLTNGGEEVGREESRIINQNVDLSKVSPSVNLAPPSFIPSSPLTSGIPSTVNTIGQNTNSFSTTGSCPGPVQQLLHQQLLHRQQQQAMLDWDRQIAMVEEELKLTRRIMELDRKEQEVKEMARQVKEQRRSCMAGELQRDNPITNMGEGGNYSNGIGCGRVPVQVRSEGGEREEMFKQIEKGRKEELEKFRQEKSAQFLLTKNKNNFQTSNDLTKHKIWDLLERKKREMNLRNESISSAGSSYNETFLRNVEVRRGSFKEAFNSDEENAGDANKLLPTFTHPNPCAPINNVDNNLTSVLREDIPHPQKLWERIQREKREEEERISGLRHSEVVMEQQEILKRIQEQNQMKKKEEELTMKLIAEMSVCDQREQLLPNRNSTAAVNTALSAAGTARGAASVAPPLWSSGGGWSVVGERNREKMVSLKISSEIDNQRKEKIAMEDWRKEMLEREEKERRTQMGKLEENKKVRVVKSADSLQTVEQDVTRGQNLGDILVSGSLKEVNQRRKSSKDEQRKLGARKKIDEQAEFEGERRKAAEELKQRIAAQVRNFFLKNLFNPQILCRRENGAPKLGERP